MWRVARGTLPMGCVALLCALALVVPLGTLPAFAESVVAQSDTAIAYVYNWNGLDVGGFPALAELHVDVDDPETTESPDHTLHHLTDANGDLWIEFDFEVRPGFTITATAGATTRTLLVTYVEVTEVDVENSVAWGMAEPLADVISRVYLEGGATTRTTTADGDGVWSVDYSFAQGDQPAHQIVPGDMVSGIIEDEYGNQSAYLFWVPNPHFNVDPYEDTIWGHEWPADAELYVSINGSEGLAEFDALANEWGDFEPWDLDGYDIEPGDLVAVTDGTVTKEHIVTSLVVTEVVVVSDIVRGTAEPGTTVWAHAEDWEGYSHREVHADAVTGEWEVDFSVAGGPGLGEQPFDIRPGTWGHANERDEDGDATFAYWHSDSPPVINIAGGSRYETAVLASEEAYPDGTETVVIATGRNWPDALGGSALAGALDAPILLVTRDAVPDVVSVEISRLEATRAVIVGGEAAVGPAVAAALQGAGLTVERVAGGNRYETADAVALRTIVEMDANYDGTAFVATGRAYADAVAAAPLASAFGWPLYLAHPTGGLSDDTKAAMAKVTTALVLGGELAVSAAVEAELESDLGDGNVTRLAGDSRYETAVAIAEHGVAHTSPYRELKWDRVGIATGQAYPDALAGGVLQGKMGSVMLLTRTASLDPATQAALAANKAAISTVTFFGGDEAVAPAVRTAVTQALE